MRRMRDSGFYDSNFMAPDLETAAEDFPDLGSKQYMLVSLRTFTTIYKIGIL